MSVGFSFLTSYLTIHESNSQTEGKGPETTQLNSCVNQARRLTHAHKHTPQKPRNPPRPPLPLYQDTHPHGRNQRRTWKFSLKWKAKLAETILQCRVITAIKKRGPCLPFYGATVIISNVMHDFADWFNTNTQSPDCTRCSGEELTVSPFALAISPLQGLSPMSTWPIFFSGSQLHSGITPERTWHGWS